MWDAFSIPSPLIPSMWVYLTFVKIGIEIDFQLFEHKRELPTIIIDYPFNVLAKGIRSYFFIN